MFCLRAKPHVLSPPGPEYTWSNACANCKNCKLKVEFSENYAKVLSVYLSVWMCLCFCMLLCASVCGIYADAAISYFHKLDYHWTAARYIIFGFGQHFLQTRLQFKLYIY